ncbi:MAG: SDR family NAD(P)-dependent oxidoreductase, partial [Sphingobacteriaceae bacterium]
MKKLEGKTAIVTGADSGIGQGTAVAFAREGANVVITYHTDREGADKTLEMVEQAGQTGLVLKCDVSEESSVQQLFDQSFATYSTIDILVNNAGVNGSNHKIAEMET